MVNYNYLASCDQRDQIGRFIALWATFQSLWQQLFYPNCPHFWAIFMKLSKHFIFLVKSFLGNFFRHLTTFYRSHWSCNTLVVVFLFRSYFCPQLFVLFVKQWQRWWLWLGGQRQFDKISWIKNASKWPTLQMFSSQLYANNNFWIKLSSCDMKPGTNTAKYP